MSIDKLNSNGLQYGGLVRFAVALCIAAGFVLARRAQTVHGVVNLN
jgi:hypothetical protein